MSRRSSEGYNAGVGWAGGAACFWGKVLEVRARKARLATYRLRCIPEERWVRDDYPEKQSKLGAICSTTKMTVHSDRIIALAKNAQIALSALLSRASLTISRVVETERKRAQRFVATVPRQFRAFKPFKLENLYSSIHRNMMSRRRPKAHDLGTDGQYSLAARRSEEASAEPSMKRPAGVTIIAIATFVGAAILAVGSCVFFFVAVMAIGGGDGGDSVSASIAGMGVAGGFSLLVLAGVAGCLALGVLQLCEWARILAISCIGIGILCTVISILTFVGYPVVPLGPMIFVHALVIGAAGWCIAYLAKPDVKQAFSSGLTLHRSN
jgi:hypothetical protein